MASFSNAPKSGDTLGQIMKLLGMRSAIYEMDDSQSRVKLDNVKPDKSYRLEDILDHPDLFKRMPELRSIPVMFSDAPKKEVYGMRPAAGNFIDRLKKDFGYTDSYLKEQSLSNVGGGIVMNYSQIASEAARGKKSGFRTFANGVKSTLLHEIQHVIDQYDKLGVGETRAFATGNRANMSASDRQIVPRSLSVSKWEKQYSEKVDEAMREYN